MRSWCARLGFRHGRVAACGARGLAVRRLQPLQQLKERKKKTQREVLQVLDESLCFQKRRATEKPSGRRSCSRRAFAPVFDVRMRVDEAIRRRVHPGGARANAPFAQGGPTCERAGRCGIVAFRAIVAAFIFLLHHLSLLNLSSSPCSLTLSSSSPVARTAACCMAMAMGGWRWRWRGVWLRVVEVRWR